MNHRPANYDRIPFRNGDEQNALGPWKLWFRWPAGVRSAIKRQYNKRVRRLWKADVRKWL